MRAMLLAFVFSAVLSSVLISAERQVEADTFETFHPYLEDGANQKGFRGTKIQYGPWQCAFGLCSLRFDWMDAYVSIWYPQYEFDYFGWYRDLACYWATETDYQAIHADEQNTPMYQRRNYWDYLDPYPCNLDIVAWTGTTDNEGMLALKYDTAFVEVSIPYLSLDAYQSEAHEVTTLP